MKNSPRSPWRSPLRALRLRLPSSLRRAVRRSESSAALLLLPMLRILLMTRCSSSRALLLLPYSCCSIRACATVCREVVTIDRQHHILRHADLSSQERMRVACTGRQLADSNLQALPGGPTGLMCNRSHHSLTLSHICTPSVPSHHPHLLHLETRHAHQPFPPHQPHPHTPGPPPAPSGSAPQCAAGWTWRARPAGRGRSRS